MLGEQGIGAFAAPQEVVAVLRADVVVALAGPDGVVAAAGADRIVVLVAGQGKCVETSYVTAII